MFTQQNINQIHAAWRRFDKPEGMGAVLRSVLLFFPVSRSNQIIGTYKE